MRIEKFKTQAYLLNTTATSVGFKSGNGELLKSIKLTEEEIDWWNGNAKMIDETVETGDIIDETVETGDIIDETPKAKKNKKKKKGWFSKRI